MRQQRAVDVMLREVNAVKSALTSRLARSVMTSRNRNHVDLTGNRQLPTAAGLHTADDAADDDDDVMVDGEIDATRQTLRGDRRGMTVQSADNATQSVAGGVQDLNTRIQMLELRTDQIVKRLV